MKPAAKSKIINTKKDLKLYFFQTVRSLIVHSINKHHHREKFMQIISELVQLKKKWKEKIIEKIIYQSYS